MSDNEGVKITKREDPEDIHALIQGRDCDFSAFIREKSEQIDAHALECEECHRRIVNFTYDLPKLREKMTVRLPKEMSLVPIITQLKALEWGQCLPYGCVVNRVPSSREQARGSFYTVLADKLNRPIEDALLCGEEMKLSNLPLTVIQLRRLRDKFWLPDMSYMCPEKRDQEEGGVVVGLPETIGEFINVIFSMRSSISYYQCREHWEPFW